MSESGIIDHVMSPVTTGVAGAATSPGDKKLKKVAGAKKQNKETKKATGSSHTASAHPPIQQMVDAAIKNLKERGGSSLLAIKKYINVTYKCDSQKLAPFIKKYLKSSVVSGKLIQTKGKGASGSFKLSVAGNKDSKVKTVKAVKVEKKKKAVNKEKSVASANKKKKVTAGSPTKKKTPNAGTAAAAAASVVDKKKSPSATVKKAIEKKKSEKAEAKSMKKAGTVKSKPIKVNKVAKSPATKPKSPKVKSATVIKPRKSSGGTLAANKKTASKK